MSEAASTFCLFNPAKHDPGPHLWIMMSTPIPRMWDTPEFRKHLEIQPHDDSVCLGLAVSQHRLDSLLSKPTTCMVEVLSATHLARRVTPRAEKRMVLQASTEILTLGFDDQSANLKLAATLTPLLQSNPFVPLAVHPTLVPFQLTLRCPPGEHTLVPSRGYTGDARGYSAVARYRTALVRIRNSNLTSAQLRGEQQ